MASSYTRSSTKQLGRGSGPALIKVPVPKRGLVARRIDSAGADVLWDSAEVDDPMVQQLSFNSDPILVGDRLYALGWCQKGFIDAYCVAFDLARNRVLWKTLLVSGQVDLTRFGELALEPQLGGLLLDGKTLYASTNLGVCAALTVGEGRVRWLTEYLPLHRSLTITERRRLRYPHRNRCLWERNPMVPLPNGILLTPLDSERAFVFDRADGRITQRRQVLGSTSYSLGRWRDQVVFCNSDYCVRVPHDQIEADGIIHSLDTTPLQARPALIDEGLIYASPRGINLLPFAESAPLRVLARFDQKQNPGPKTRRTYRRLATPPDGAITAIEHNDRTYILVTHTYGVRCYRTVSQ